MADARKYLRRGVLPSMRPKLWRLAFGLEAEVSPAETKNFDNLKEMCDRVEYITDELYMFDVQTNIDEPKFFVFEEELKEVALCFSRDTWIRINSLYSIHQPLFPKILSASQDIQWIGAETCVPPCGVLPFAGLSMYNAPMCYLYRNRPSLYSLCRVAYARLWCKLNVVSSDVDTILPICFLFECLVMESCPRLFIHLVKIGVQPLQIAFSWIHGAFVNLLEIDQLILLWDRIIGYMDVTLLSVLAAAIFVARSEPLMQVRLSLRIVKCIDIIDV